MIRNRPYYNAYNNTAKTGFGLTENNNEFQRANQNEQYYESQNGYNQNQPRNDSRQQQMEYSQQNRNSRHRDNSKDRYKQRINRLKNHKNYKNSEPEIKNQRQLRMEQSKASKKQKYLQNKYKYNDGQEFSSQPIRRQMSSKDKNLVQSEYFDDFHGSDEEYEYQKNKYQKKSKYYDERGPYNDYEEPDRFHDLNSNVVYQGQKHKRESRHEHEQDFQQTEISWMQNQSIEPYELDEIKRKKRDLINLQVKQFKNFQFDAFLEFCKKNPVCDSETSFDLRGYFAYCDIFDEGVQRLAYVFKENTSVQNLKLNLEGNAITDQGMENFFKMLEKNKAIEVLYLNLSCRVYFIS